MLSKLEIFKSGETMGKFVDLTGQTYGRWHVIERAKNKGNATMWKCKCICEKGTIRDVAGYTLRKGFSKSCGCLHNELLVERCTKHGYAKQVKKERLYAIWSSMKKRCYNSNSQYFHDYGGRGITICVEWLDKENGSKNFIEWAKSNGYKENLEIDRIDNDKGYSPDNCRWATEKEQANNKRNNHYITYNGERHTKKEWAEIKGLTYSALTHRIDRGWDIEKALNTPVKNIAKGRDFSEKKKLKVS